MSIETKHTPGPWRVSRANPSPTTGEWMIAGAKPGYLAEVRNCGSGDLQANARLIAAAPELLAALRGMVALDEENHQRESDDIDVCAEVQAAYAAIAKATGGEA